MITGKKILSLVLVLATCLSTVSMSGLGIEASAISEYSININEYLSKIFLQNKTLLLETLKEKSILCLRHSSLLVFANIGFRPSKVSIPMFLLHY